MLIDLPLVKGRLRSDRCLVMGILNATPDSFSDGGELDHDAGLHARIQGMLADGADILDVGGESTRPGHAQVPADDEIRRVVRVIEAIRCIDAGVPISIDTSKAIVAQAAFDAGASFLNDVTGLRDPGMAPLLRTLGCGAVLMRDEDIDGEIVQGCRSQLEEILARARRAGIQDVVLDPGLGFGARPGAFVADNLALIDHVADYALGRPVLIGASRKRFVGAWADVPDPRKRGPASAALAVRARDAGAAIVRVHDVGRTVEALRP